MKKALITGITGQDGAYLTRLLLDKGYEVHGIRRRTSQFNTSRIDALYHDLHESGAPLYLHHGDMTDGTSLLDIVRRTKPSEIYNLAAQSHVMVSFETPEYTANVNALGALRLLDAIRILGIGDNCRFYQASTSEMFGGRGEVPQNEDTIFAPRSPYAAAKLYAYWMTTLYRESYGLFACNGILFNHESPLRGETFVTRKITRGLARIKAGLQECLYLGNLNSLRDWGHARDYVEMQWLMLQQDKPDDFVIATGIQTTVRTFATQAAEYLGFGKLEWIGEGLDEIAKDSGGKTLIKVDPMYFRPAEVENLLGDSKKANKVIGWKPKTTLHELIREMCDEDYRDALARKVSILSK